MERVLAKLRSIDRVVVACPIDEKAAQEYFDRDEDANENASMPIDNEGLRESRTRQLHICIAYHGDMPVIDQHMLEMRNAEGQVLGFDVPVKDRAQYERRDDIVWLSDDFLLLPNVGMGSDVKMVMLAQHLVEVGPADGAADLVMIVPTTPVDVVMRQKYGIDQDVQRIATSIVSFNPA